MAPNPVFYINYLGDTTELHQLPKQKRAGVA
jgi:hypothetical protein